MENKEREMKNSLDKIAKRNFIAKNKVGITKKKRSKINNDLKTLVAKDSDFDASQQTICLEKTDCAIVFKQNGAMKVYMAIRDPSKNGFEGNEELTMALASMCAKTNFTENIINSFRTILAKGLKTEFSKQDYDEDDE